MAINNDFTIGYLVNDFVDKPCVYFVEDEDELKKIFPVNYS